VDGGQRPIPNALETDVTQHSAAAAELVIEHPRARFEYFILSLVAAFAGSLHYFCVFVLCLFVKINNLNVKIFKVFTYCIILSKINLLLKRNVFVVVFINYVFIKFYKHTTIYKQ